MYNPYAYSFHEGLYRTYGTVARVYGILGVRPPAKDLTTTMPLLIEITRNRTYSLWFLTPRHAAIFLSRVKCLRKPRVTKGTCFPHSYYSRFSNSRSLNMQAFGPALSSISGGQVLFKTYICHNFATLRTALPETTEVTSPRIQRQSFT